MMQLTQRKPRSACASMFTSLNSLEVDRGVSVTALPGSFVIASIFVGLD